ncbi:MAG: hypothetical protein HQK69_10355, partial [Desulfamplus sp.]|nr:hypothetical protein [Desulfamplus sp.]
MKWLNKISVLLILAGYFYITMPYLTINPFVGFIGAILSILVGFYIFDFKNITQHEKLKTQKHISGQWWEMFLNHPARMMLTTFMALCFFGTILLILPISASNNNVSISTSHNLKDTLPISTSNKLESFRKS